METQIKDLNKSLIQRISILLNIKEVFSDWMKFKFFWSEKY